MPSYFFAGPYTFSPSRARFHLLVLVAGSLPGTGPILVRRREWAGGHLRRAASGGNERRRRELMHLVTPVVNAMWTDALTAPYLCTDATGVLVQALEKCRNAHFFVVAAPQKYVLFFYSQKHDSAAVDEILEGYRGYLVADAHTVYDHLYKSGDVVEVACWAHARRYFFKALDSEPQRARDALALIQRVFRLEREIASFAPEVRSARRAKEARTLVDEFLV